MDLKDLHEWVIKPQLRTLPGVSEINAWGGQTKQYQIVVDPACARSIRTDTARCRVASCKRTIRTSAAATSNMPRNNTRCIGTGRAVTTDDLGNIVLLAKDGTPVLLRDVGEVRIGSAPPEGATLRNGETVSGMVIMLKGENGKQLIERVKERIASLPAPAGRQDRSVLRPGFRDRRDHPHGGEEPV